VYSSLQKLCHTPTVNSHVIWNHTVLPATQQSWESRLYPQPKQVLDLATPEGCKARLTYVGIPLLTRSVVKLSRQWEINFHVLIITPSASSGKHKVTVWRPNVSLSVPSAYLSWLTRVSMRRGQRTFRPTIRRTNIGYLFFFLQHPFVTFIDRNRSAKKLSAYFGRLTNLRLSYSARLLPNWLERALQILGSSNVNPSNTACVYCGG